MLISIFDLMGAQTDRLRCEVCHNLILSPMNTGLLRHAVATALTVYGIETIWYRLLSSIFFLVATALTVYGIETIVELSVGKATKLSSCNSTYRLRYWNDIILSSTVLRSRLVATALTVYGIETLFLLIIWIQYSQLQQYLPFTVLKLKSTHE